MIHRKAFSAHIDSSNYLQSVQTLASSVDQWTQERRRGGAGAGETGERKK